MGNWFLYVLVLLFAACSLSSCYYDPADFHGGLQSDGYLQYSTNGITVLTADSIKAGDPSIFLLSGYYFRQAALLQIQAFSSAQNQRLSLYLLHCKDTGLFNLGASSGSSGSFGGWNTDSMHTGQVHLTRFDTLKGKVAGTFYFQAVNKNLTPDSVSIDSGSFFDYPILLSQ